MENRMNGNAVRVWTKQHENVLRELETKGRYVARREYIQADLGEHAPLVLEAYDWLVKHTPAAADRPLSADTDALRCRYAERYDLYCAAADLRVDGDGTPEETAAQIEKEWTT